MTRTPRTVTIGAPGFEAVCPVPREGIGLFEAVALTLRGRIDAARNRDVADDAHTHSLHRLLAAHRRREMEAVRRIDGALSVVDRTLAPLEAVLETQLPEEGVIPTTTDLEGLPDIERAQWAARVRAAQSATAKAQAVAARHASATTEAATLRSARTALSVEGDDVRRQWREAYAMRAARYTRARFGRGGGELTAEPSLAVYLPADAPTVVRVR